MIHRAKLQLAALTASLATSMTALAEPPLAFVPEPHADYLTKGQARILGRADLFRNGSAVASCAGRTVTLLPATDYFRLVVAALQAGRSLKFGGDIPPAVAGRLMRQTACDSNGWFAYEGLPDGEWLLLLKLRPREPGDASAAVAVAEAITQQHLPTIIDIQGPSPASPGTAPGKEGVGASSSSAPSGQMSRGPSRQDQAQVHLLPDGEPRQSRNRPLSIEKPLCHHGVDS